MLIPIIRCKHEGRILSKEDIFVNPDYIVYISHSHPDLEKLKAKSVIYMSKESPVTMVFTRDKFEG